MTYTTKEAAEQLGITKDALFYYEKEGLLPEIKRDKHQRRVYTDSDLEWIYLICCLRNTDMPISKVKQYITLLKESGRATISQRRSILAEHQIFMEKKIAAYQTFLQMLQKKIEFYDDALTAPDPEKVKCTDYVSEWENFKKFLEGKDE